MSSKKESKLVEWHWKLKGFFFIGNQAYGLCVTRRELIQAFLGNGFDVFILSPG